MSFKGIPSKFCVTLFGMSLLVGCASTWPEAEDMPLMTYNDCANSRFCRVKGLLEIREVDHVLMGRLTLENGDCLNVSLPKKRVNAVRGGGPLNIEIIGRVFPSNPSPDIVKISISGRRVGLNQCGNILLFVK